MQNKSLDRLYIGNRSAGLTRAYIQFAAMPTIPEGSTITGATMTLHFTSGTSTAANASAYQVTGGEWASGTIQWSNKPAADVLLHGDIGHNNVTGYTINCLTAVQHWYDGDSTGQNENYGIMLCYYDETTADYNAVYSADYSVESKRPKLVITYKDPSISILEGYTHQLSVSGVSDTVTWSSSNTTVATVNASGVVTGVNAGQATVTASVGGTAYQSFTVYVKIQNGVYYIENIDAGKYLGTLGSATENTLTTLYSKATSGIEQLNQLWKITYLGSGYYSIRPMYMLSMGLHATDNTVDITTVGTDDTLNGVPLINRWGIEHGSDGYKFTHVGTGSLTMKATASYSDYIVSTEVYSSSKTGFLWDLDRVTSVTDQVLLLDAQTGVSAEETTRYVDPEQKVSLNDLGITASFVSTLSIDQSITWNTQNPSVVSVDSESGEITPLTPGGTATIVAKHIHNGVGYEAYFAVYIKPVPDGTYFVRSRAYNKYIQIISGNTSNGASIEQWSYHGEENQKWSIIWRGNGYYSIICEQSGKALSVASGQTGSTEVSLVQETYTGSARQLWKIIATNEGRYKIKAKSAEGNTIDLVMTAGHALNNDSNGVNIEQCQYTNDDNYIDEWFICPIIDIGMSTDDYTYASDDRDRKSYIYATSFYTGLTYPLGIAPLTLTHRYNKDSTHEANKNDFAINGAMSNDIDFMVYIGHGHVADGAQDSQHPDWPWGNHIQYSYSTEGEEDLTVVCNTKDDPEEIATFCLYTSEVNFGSDESNLRWVWMYTCNFLNSREDYEQYHNEVPIENNQFVTDAHLKEMMTGAHIVMGYATQSYLCDPNATIFANYLHSGEPIIDAFFRAGSEGEGAGKENGGTDDHHIQKVMFISQARYETIYSPRIHFEYDSSDILILTHDIQERY